MYLTIQRPEVVHETVDDEVVIVNLEKGRYYSAEGAGAYVWSRVAHGDSVQSILQWAERAFGDAARADVQRFVDALLSNGIVVASDQPVPDEGAVEIVAPSSYVKADLEVFSDMEDLLLLDPVHDVEAEQGWPHAAG